MNITKDVRIKMLVVMSYLTSIGVKHGTNEPGFSSLPVCLNTTLTL